MSDELTITAEQVDDFPILMAQMERMTVPDLLDRHFPVQGNWSGLSLGWIGTCWLGQIVSVGDHRLNHVQGWVEKNLITVQGSIQRAVTGLDFNDDRLENILGALSNDTGWAAFEAELNQRSLRVYDLKAEAVRRSEDRFPAGEVEAGSAQGLKDFRRPNNLDIIRATPLKN